MRKVTREVLKGKLLYGVLMLAACVLIVGTLWQVWIAATAKFGIEGNCKFEEVEYVYLQGNGSCVFPLVQGDTSICALPKKFECSGAVRDIALARAVMELKRGG